MAADRRFPDVAGEPAIFFITHNTRLRDYVCDLNFATTRFPNHIMFCMPCRSLVRPLTVRKRKGTVMRKMEMDHLRTLSPTPPLPPRNPNRRFSQYQQPLLPLID